MGHYHGTIVAERQVGPLLLSWASYAGGRPLIAHEHRRPYASVIVRGTYTELSDLSPRLCGAGDVLLHGAGEVHADFFHESCVVLNGELISESGENLLTTFLDHVRPLVPALRVTAFCDMQRPMRGLEAFDWLGDTPIRTAAEITGKHPADFSRAFRQHVGETPSRYRRRVRIRHAVRRMLESTDKLAAIALDCGYSDQSHFNNAFFKETGMAPLSFKRAFCR